jgi:CheY-like chemotaxis protein
MPTILIVDDLLSDRRIAEGLLKEDTTLEFVFAENGRIALEQIELHVPDLVLTDMQMPELDGLELVRQVHDTYPLMPTILMTAAGSEIIAREAIERGAASYVPKQHLASELLSTVQRVLALSGEERLQTRLLNRLKQSTWELENDPELVSGLVAHLRTLLQQKHVCNESDLLRVSSAIDEALLNALYHGNLEIDSSLKEEDHNAFHDLAKRRRHEPPYGDRTISVTVCIDAENLRIVIADQGTGFDPSTLPDPTDPEYLLRPSGRGLLLMRAFMDDVQFNDTGNEVTLIKKCGNSTEDEDA